MPKNINLKNGVYALERKDDEAELTLYGDIYEQQPTDWWGDPIEGEFITLEGFLEDLKGIEGAKHLTIRMHSYGGDAAVANMIHNRLRELSNNGTKTTCIVDGVAMSGGSVIMCACDEVKVNPNSIIMIHCAWSALYGGYNAKELRKQATSLDAWDNAMVSVYARKTGQSETVIRHMMEETTYMTGKEAKEKGFADEVLDEEPVPVAASADGRMLIVAGRKIHLVPGMFAPDFIPTEQKAAEKPAANESGNHEAEAPDSNTTTPALAEGNSEGGKTPMSTIKELREANPELVAQLEAEAADTERARLQGIDEIADSIDSSLVTEAKYGKDRCSAAELSLRAVKAAQKQGKKFLDDLGEDAQASGTEKVPASEPKHDEAQTAQDEETIMDNARSIVKGALGKKAEKKEEK